MSRRLKIFCFVGITMAFAGLWGIKDTYAAPGKSELITKAYANGIGKCSNNAFFAPEISASSVRGFDSVIGNYGFGDIRNPNGLEGGSAGAINCGKLFSEHVSTSKFPSYSQENASAVNSALLDVGYKSNGASGGSENCINISYHITSDSSNAKKTTNSLCFNVGNDENRTISADEINGRNDMPSASGDGVSLGFGTCMNFPNYKCVLAYYGGEVHDAGSKQFTSSANWYDIVSDVKTAASDINKVVSANGGSFIYHDADTSETSSGGGSSNYIYDSSNNTANASKILNYLTSYGSWSNVAFNNTEQYWFYMYILTDYYGAKIDATNCSGSQSGNAVAVRNEKNERRYCAVSSATNTNAGEVNIFSAGGSHYLDRKGGFDDVLKALQNEVSAGSIPVNELYQVDEGNGTTTDPSTTDPSNTDPTTPTDGESGNASDAEDVCYGSAGTLGMGWVLCPILSGTSNALNWVYDSIVKDYLEVKPGLVSNNDVYKDWQIFQNIANIIMVIFLLVVVFSQLTGIGIDNYGIKKILPRLIICAILINLSYFIVQFLVDVSNIVGASIAGIFQIQGSGVSADSYSGLDIPSNILGISIITAFGAGVAAVVANPAILLSFLLVILSGLISVLMMWLILVARQAGVVIAVVIAPLAFAMYLLPNTSKFTKSWGNIVKGLLLLYPLAALLIGASFFASNLIASLGDNFALPAMLLRVVPFFALPSLFRKSIDAIGNIGTKIQGFGRSLGRGATGAIRGSDAFKNAQERGMERRTRIRAGLDQNGNEATGWRGLLRSRSARNRARYRSQYLKNQSDQNRADLLNDPEYIEAMRQKQAVQDQAERNEIALMNSEDYRNAVAAKQATDLEKRQTEAQASALVTGTFKTTDGTPVDSSSIGSLRDALISEASRDGEQDVGKIRALYDSLLAKGDDGIDALAKVWDSGKLKGEGLERITESVASDGSIKAKARSFHATANDVLSGAKSYDTRGGQVDAARVAGTYASKIKPEMLSNMTDDERNNYINYASKTGDSSAMQNIYAASQNINSFKPNERTAVYNIADRYVQDHMELAKAGTYTYKDYNGNTQTAQLRRDANNVLVMDTTRPDGTVATSPIRADFFKSGDFRLKRN